MAHNATAARKDADALLRQGLARHQAGDLPGAGALYRRVLSLDPRAADALNLLGVLARQEGDLPRALDLARRAVALRPDAPVYLAALGATLAEAGKLDEAVPALLRAVSLRPSDAVSRRNLGQALCALGRVGEALPHLREAAALTPEDAEALLALAHGLREAGDVPASTGAARRALAAAGDGPVAAQARFLLAALGAEAAPDRAPAAYVRDLFDAYAPRFEADLTGRLEYRTPAVLAALLGRAGVSADAALDVLDLGCGTGLSGVALRPWARRLTGLDLSPRMLAEAARHGIYDALEEADLTEYLPAHPAAFDVIAAADVLNYLGDLRPALAGIAAALRPGGHAAFSLETGDTAPYALGEGLRYRHHPGHVLDLSTGLGLRPIAREETILRRERGADVAGTLLVLRRD
ncbi:methyltransferase domain-containing protein [Muricoccus radiodurans]|uniref:class I SAM-dependent DNA methyltransferase n=1 Tax=Muricoccus radiodurans TaxID=2231721 RepID=UPI003CEB4AFC